jgi:hypothetical protein
VNASDWIALVALLVAVAVAVRGELNVRAERKDREKEDGRRDEELELLRQQASAGQAAQLAVFEGVQADGSERGIQYNVPVQNTGSSGASEIAVELVDGQSVTGGRSATPHSLVAGERLYVGVVTPPRDRYTGPYEIYFEWKDGRGPQRAASGIQVGAP